MNDDVVLNVMFGAFVVVADVLNLNFPFLDGDVPRRSLLWSVHFSIHKIWLSV